MSLSQNELVWVRIRLERESVFEWISEKKTLCLNPTQQNSRWLPSSSWVRMNEWRFFCANGGNQSWQLWMSLRRKTKMAESMLTKLNMAEFKMAAIIKLSQNEWVKFYFVQNGWIQNGRVQDSCHHQVESEWMSEVFFLLNGWIHDGRVQDSCHHQVELKCMSEVFFVQNGWIKNGRFQDSCHHQVESEWMSEVFLCKCWELILASVSGFERKN